MSDNNIIEMNNKTNIHNMELHQTIEIPGACIMRVSGGWLYSMIEDFGEQKIILPPVFVKLNNEFKGTE